MQSTVRVFGVETKSKDSIEPQVGQKTAEMRILEVNNVIRCTYKGQCGSQLELSTHNSQIFIALNPVSVLATSSTNN